MLQPFFTLRMKGGCVDVITDQGILSKKEVKFLFHHFSMLRALGGILVDYIVNLTDNLCSLFLPQAYGLWQGCSSLVST